ncbi:MAG: NAD-dependent epimerase/dehydratase family protein [Alphaproteobacteria bacterium]|nr:NAD-dependent epimerase/dehydratase family protein [Alphaproteobacteria bacterium]
MTAPGLTLLTGATGFVGAALARLLCAEGWNLRVLSRKRSDRSNLTNLNVTIAEGDLTDADSLRAAVQGCDALFHVAADYRIWVPDPMAMHRANVIGTRTLLEAAQEAGVKRIVYTSSVATLGLNSNGTPADEATPSSLATMVGTYKKSKYLAEQEVHKLIAARQLPCVIVNPSTPIGPYDIKPTPTGRMIVEAARGMMPAFVDTGLNVVHVDDVAMGHLQAFRQGHFGERYILGGENLSLSAILALVAQVTNRSPPRIKLPVSGLMPLAYAAEAVARITGKEPFVTRDGLLMAKKKMYFRSTKAEAALGYNHRPAADAIADAVRWFKEKGYC